jgi:hypothetical protein
MYRNTDIQAVRHTCADIHMHAYTEIVRHIHTHLVIVFGIGLET